MKAKSIYHDVSVGKSEGDILEFRKLLVHSVAIVLENGLKILNIPIPKKM